MTLTNRAQAGRRTWMPTLSLALNNSSRLEEFRHELEAAEMENRKRLSFDLAIAQLESIEESMKKETPTAKTTPTK